jgi:hypothetical protein
VDDFDKILARIRYLADGQNVLRFRIGATDDLVDRLSDYDYRHRGYSYGQHEILAEGPDRLNILDLERRSQQAMASHLKYDGGSKHHIPSLAYDKSVYYLYLAWVDASWQNGWEIDRELLMSIARRDPPGVTTPVRYKDDDESFRAIRSGPSQYVLGFGERELHFHRSPCCHAHYRTARSTKPNPLTGGRNVKFASPAMQVLLDKAERHHPPRLADKAKWHVCSCLIRLAAELSRLDHP